MDTILYARFSTAGQAHGTSIERQFSIGEEFANFKDWTVVDRVCDDGKSAYHGANRLEGAELAKLELAAADYGLDGKAIVVENIDRLSRQGFDEVYELLKSFTNSAIGSC